MGKDNDGIKTQNYELIESIIINASKSLCHKFIDKVDSGRVRSVETYRDCKELLSLIDIYDNKGR